MTDDRFMTLYNYAAVLWATSTDKVSEIQDKIANQNRTLSPPLSRLELIAIMRDTQQKAHDAAYAKLPT